MSWSISLQYDMHISLWNGKLCNYLYFMEYVVRFHCNSANSFSSSMHFLLFLHILFSMDICVFVVSFCMSKCNIKCFFSFIFRFLIIAIVFTTTATFGQYLQPVELNAIGTECALILPGGARSSAYDHTLNLFRVGGL